MGWRKWTILDGDLARCTERASATEEAHRTPTLPVGGMIECGSISEWLV